MAALPRIDFKQIRAQGGSQHRAFEELCFQLLGDLAEAPPGARIVRHGTPDGGVEFLVELPKGGKWAWQAKYLFRIDDGALSQLDGSVKQALSSHPDLTRYTFCIPYNRPASTAKGRKSAIKKWEDRVRKWSGWARKRRMEVDFVYLGESELLRALTEERHAGRVRYWFGQDVFTSERLQKRLDEALLAAGPRYTRELHVDLPIAEVFDGLCRTPRYHERLRRKLRQVRESQRYWGEGLEVISADQHAAELCQGLRTLVADVDRQVLALDFSTPGSVELPKLVTSCKAARAHSTELWRHLEGVEAEAQRQRRERGEGSRSGRSLEGLKSVRWSILKLEDALEELESFADSDSALAVNTRAAFVVGEAGSGKTHLLCDVARQRIEEGHPTLLLLGQHFAGGDLWQQILRQADFEGRTDEFLGALEAAAQASGGQALLCIDALNEAGDLGLWENHVSALLERVRHYPWVSIALSCRTSYEEDLLPADRFGDHVVRVEHRGFASKTQEAVRRFFRHYGLTEPDFPLTLPELGNPLFLKLMCKSLSGGSSSGLPRGVTAVTSIFEGFLQEVEKRLAKRCDYSPSRELVRHAVENLAQDMLDSEAEWVSFERAEEVTQELLRRPSWSESLLNGLIDEGVLLRDRPPAALNLGTKEVVRFAYQRLGDHLCAQRICAKGLTAVRQWLDVEPDELRSLVFFRSGWIKALAIQLPEQFGIELHDLVSDRSIPTLQDAFLQSLIWRSPETVDPERCFSYLREISRDRDGTYDAPILDVLLQVAVLPTHPFNAEFLHDQLVRRTMPHRDAFWSIWVHWNRDEESSLGRLISWAETGDVTRLSEEGAELAAITLTWCFSTSNRRIRDRATKALVTLLESNPKLAEKLLDMFGGVDDPYVLERLYGAIYGALLACHDPETIAAVARWTYSRVFADRQPPVHLLIRDYASGILELGLEVCGELEGVDPALVRPPYNSPWPIRAAKVRKEFLKENSAYGSIQSSVRDWDFHRYVIEPAVRRFLPPNQPRRRSEERARRHRKAKALEEAFEQNLTPQQGKLLDEVQETDSEPTISAFHRSLSEDQSAQLASAMFARHTANQSVGAVQFDADLASRWIANRVLTLGWRPNLFLEFDKSVKGWGRNAPGAERIGKKYQWIALHELLARLADHCEREEWGQEARFVQGLWELEQRDIDPTYRLAPDEEAPAWPSFQLLSERIEDEDAWVRTLADCAPLPDLVDLEDPDRRRWLVLESYPEWREEAPPEVEPWSVEHRRLSCHIRSCLLRRADLATFLDWAEGQRFFGSWMPESYILSGGFLGEYPWHPSTLGGQQDWTLEGRSAVDLPTPVLVTTCKYSWSRSQDYSIKDSVTGLLPNGPVLRGLHGAWSGSGLSFVDADRRVVAWDPSDGRRDGVSPSCLLVDPDALRRYLEEQELALVWIIVGEKIVHPGGLGVPRRFVRGDISSSLYLDDGEVRLHSLRLYGEDLESEGTYSLTQSIGQNR